MSRAEGGFEDWDGEESPTEYFDYYWKKEISKIPLNVAVIIGASEMKKDKEYARQADEVGDAARSRVVIKRRILGALPKDSQATLGTLEQMNLAQFGDPREGQLADVVGDLMYDALHTWTRNSKNQGKLKNIARDRGYMQSVIQEHHETTELDYLEGYIFDQTLYRLLHRTQ